MKTKLMGILNLTKDSFSGDGLLSEDNFLESTINQAKIMLASGATILDIGAESSKPGAVAITPEEEWLRLQPVLSELTKLKTIISIDTYHAKTAKLALQNGAHWINSIWGFQKDPQLLSVIKEFQAPIVIMHNTADQAKIKEHSKLGAFYDQSSHQDVISEIIRDLTIQISEALAQGILEKQIMIDPGIGFGKTPQENLQIIRNLPALKKLGFPILLGASRKSFIGAVLDLPVTERLEGTLAVCTLAVQNGIEILRVHDVKEVARVIKLTEAILNA